MKTHCSILAWEIPWTEEPGGLEALHLIPGSGRSPGGGNENPPQYSCLENPKDRGAWWATGYGVTESQTRPSDYHFFLTTSQGGMLSSSSQSLSALDAPRGDCCALNHSELWGRMQRQLVLVSSCF